MLIEDIDSHAIEIQSNKEQRADDNDSIRMKFEANNFFTPRIDVMEPIKNSEGRLSTA